MTLLKIIALQKINMKFEIENNVIASYKRLSYDAWFAFAEFVDNSTQAYFDNKELLDKIFSTTGEHLRVVIEYDPQADLITITDNSIGMSEYDLDKALKVGRPPDVPTGRSKYGLGMKTAACWFGDNWGIKTKKYGEKNGVEISIDVDEIAKQIGDVEIKPTTFEAGEEEHYTILYISNLNRRFVGRTLGKIREFLSSIYRFDFSGYGLELFWNGSQLEWQGFENKLYVGKDGVRSKKQFEFEINGKPVKGWVGVIGKGASRKIAGFAIIQNNRVIQTNFKPSKVFGEQEEGSNDLVNQRVLGELFLDKFSVSHTKDKIVWEKNEEEELDIKLGEICADMRELALTLRFKKDNQKDELALFKEEAVNIISSELKSSEITNYLKTVQPYPEKVIATSFSYSSDRVKGENEPTIEVTIGSEGDLIHVIVFFNENSEFEPYVLTETTIEDNKVIVIINILHPHVQEMTSADSLTNFIRHCIYDGVAEWKAIKLRGDIQPYTIRFLKDGLLRIPFEIKSHKAV